MVKLDIIADIACPWCYVGKAYLMRAMEKRGDHPFIIEWHPFQLSPDMPKQGVDRAGHMKRIFGSEDAVVKAHIPLMEHAKKAGVTFNLEAIKVSPNTQDAHRLIHWAGIEGKQHAVVNALYKAYWAEGKNIGDIDVLVDIAEKALMDGEMVRRLLESDADIEAVQAREDHSRRAGVRSVPTFIVANQHAVSGAQPTELWLSVMEDIAKLTPEGEFPEDDAEEE